MENEETTVPLDKLVWGCIGWSEGWAQDEWKGIQLVDTHSREHELSVTRKIIPPTLIDT